MTIQQKTNQNIEQEIELNLNSELANNNDQFQLDQVIKLFE